MPNPIIHQIAFGVTLLSTTGRNIYLLSRIPADHPSRKIVAKTQLNGVLTFVVGFICWNVDNFFCAQLRKGRQMIGPLGFLLEGKRFSFCYSFLIQQY
jgi:dihydroceramidase